MEYSATWESLVNNGVTQRDRGHNLNWRVGGLVDADLYWLGSQISLSEGKQNIFLLREGEWNMNCFEPSNMYVFLLKTLAFPTLWQKYVKTDPLEGAECIPLYCNLTRLCRLNYFDTLSERYKDFELTSSQDRQVIRRWAQDMVSFHSFSNLAKPEILPFMWRELSMGGPSGQTLIRHWWENSRL